MKASTQSGDVARITDRSGNAISDAKKPIICAVTYSSAWMIEKIEELKEKKKSFRNTFREPAVALKDLSGQRKRVSTVQFAEKGLFERCENELYIPLSRFYFKIWNVAFKLTTTNKQFGSFSWAVLLMMLTFRKMSRGTATSGG